MATDNYGLKAFGQGGQFSEDGYQFTQSDRDLIDRLLFQGAEAHKHDGATAAGVTPTTGPELTLATSGGFIGPGRRVRYKYTLVDALGFESAASAETFVDTPSPIATPDAPTLVTALVGGTLLFGHYYYVLSAYVTATTSETRALNPADITVGITTNTNTVTLTLPALPAGAEGWNIYRRSPNSTKYEHLDSVDMTVATPPTEYVDDGSVSPDCNRTLPSKNTTFSTNAITLSIGGATPNIPTGYTWRIYRTYVSGDYSTSLLKNRTEETFVGSGIIDPTYTDVGTATVDGQPPTSTQLIDSPSQIDLTDAAEVTGTLPMGRVSAFPTTLTFSLAGTLSASTGTFVWVNPFDQARVVSVRAALGVGSVPASSEVIIDVNKGTLSATPIFATIFATPGDRPTVPVGFQIGDEVAEFGGATPVDPFATGQNYLDKGESLSLDIDQDGGGATPTDQDLTVTIKLYVDEGDEDVTEVWP